MPSRAKAWSRSPYRCALGSIYWPHFRCRLRVSVRSNDRGIGHAGNHILGVIGFPPHHAHLFAETGPVSLTLSDFIHRDFLVVGDHHDLTFYQAAGQQSLRSSGSHLWDRHAGFSAAEQPVRNSARPERLLSALDGTVDDLHGLGYVSNSQFSRIGNVSRVTRQREFDPGAPGAFRLRNRRYRHPRFSPGSPSTEKYPLVLVPVFVSHLP